MATYTWSQCGSTFDFNWKYSPIQQPLVQINTSNTLIGKQLNSITTTCKNPSSVSGTCYIEHKNSDGSVTRSTSDTVNNSTIGTGDTSVTWTFSSPAAIQIDDIFQMITDTGDSMKVKVSGIACTDYTRLGQYTSSTYTFFDGYDFIGSAEYEDAPEPSGGTFMPPPIAPVYI